MGRLFRCRVGDEAVDQCGEGCLTGRGVGAGGVAEDAGGGDGSHAGAHELGEDLGQWSGVAGLGGVHAHQVRSEMEQDGGLVVTGVRIRRRLEGAGDARDVVLLVAHLVDHALDGGSVAAVTVDQDDRVSPR